MQVTISDTLSTLPRGDIRQIRLASTQSVLVLKPIGRNEADGSAPAVSYSLPEPLLVYEVRVVAQNDLLSFPELRRQ